MTTRRVHLNGERMGFPLCGPSSRRQESALTWILERVTCPSCLTLLDRLLELGYQPRRGWALRGLQTVYRWKDAPSLAKPVHCAHWASIRGWLQARGLTARTLKAGAEPKPVRVPPGFSQRRGTRSDVA
jgi:hypothetical protein